MKQKEMANKDSKQRNIQDYLSLGYVYLIIAGILFDTVFYGILGINIIHYSSILDVLLSPIAFLTSSIVIPLLLGAGILFGFGISRWSRNYHHKNRDKDWYKNKYDIADLDKKHAKNSLEGRLKGLAMVLLVFFMSYSTGNGNRIKEAIASNEIKLNKRITFQNDSIIEVKFIGMNSQYVFYLLENDSIITASPIQGNIKGIRDLESVDKK